MKSDLGASPYWAMYAVRPSPPQSMVNQGRRSSSMVAIADPSSTAEALPTPWGRNCQVISVPPRPDPVVGLAQAREVVLHGVGRPLATQLHERALQAREIAL